MGRRSDSGERLETPYEFAERWLKRIRTLIIKLPAKHPQKNFFMGALDKLEKMHTSTLTRNEAGDIKNEVLRLEPQLQRIERNRMACWAILSRTQALFGRLPSYDPRSDQFARYISELHEMIENGPWNYDHFNSRYIQLKNIVDRINDEEKKLRK